MDSIIQHDSHAIAPSPFSDLLDGKCPAPDKLVYRDDSTLIYHADCRDILPLLPKATLIFFDPPYGLNIAAWDKEFNAKDVATLCLDRLTDDGSLYATCSQHILERMMQMLPYRRLITWGKPNLPLRKHLKEWEWSSEYVLWVTKTDSFIFNKPHGEKARDYWRVPVENGFLNKDGNTHPARKPVELLKLIISTSTNEGDLIIDPFMGSGTTLRAARELGRRAIGVDTSLDYCMNATSRLTQVARPRPGQEQMAFAV